MNVSFLGKNFDDLQNIGRTYASQTLTTSAKTLEAAAKFLEGVADRIATKAETADAAEAVVDAEVSEPSPAETGKDAKPAPAAAQAN